MYLKSGEPFCAVQEAMECRVLLCLLGSAVLGVVSDPDQVCYGELGCFSTLPPWNRMVDRENNLFFTAKTAPPPRSPQLLNVTVQLHTRRMNDGGMLFYSNMQFHGVHLNESLPCYFLVHGYNGSTQAPYLILLKNALLDRENANVLMVNWGTLWGPDNYAQSVSDTRVVGAEIALIVEKLRYRARCQMFIHLMGHSLGAQIAGYAGKTLNRKGCKPLNRISGLDPAGIGFRKLPSKMRLCAGDAVFVDAVHTDITQLGTDEAHADVDFFMNGGKIQPECTTTSGNVKDPMLIKMMVHACSHIRAVNFTAYAMSSDNCTYWGIQAYTNPCARNPRAVPASISLTKACELGWCSVLDEPQILPARGRVNVNTTKSCGADENEFLRSYELLLHKSTFHRIRNMCNLKMFLSFL